MMNFYVLITKIILVLIDQTKTSAPINFKKSGVWRAIIRSGKNAKLKIKSILQEEKDYCLHFDGKRLSNHEY